MSPDKVMKRLLCTHFVCALLLLVVNASTNAAAPPVEEWRVVEERRRAAREHFLEQLNTLKTTRLFSLDSYAFDGKAPSGSGLFHDWIVVASAAPADANAAEAITRSLATVVSAHKDGQDSCFDPHHGLTLTNGKESFDVLLCFNCSRYVVLTPDGEIVFLDSFSARSEKEIILAEEDDFAGMNEEWLRWFPSNPPARQGAKLPVRVPGLKVSIAAVAEA